MLWFAFAYETTLLNFAIYRYMLSGKTRTEIALRKPSPFGYEFIQDVFLVVNILHVSAHDVFNTSNVVKAIQNHADL